MGLTIGYQLSARRPLKLAALPKLIAPLRDAAHDLGFERVGELVQIGPDYLGQFEQPRGMKKCQLADLLPPAEGWVFSAVPGDGSESVEIGLCRHEGLPGWRWRGGCKTQYASRHGWGHFRDCHRRVVDLLRACEKAGWRVKVMDEGRYWETRSETALRAKIGEYDRLVAALGGVLKDAAESAGERVHGSIFDDPRFERLEAEGRQEHESSICRLLPHLPDPHGR